MAGNQKECIKCKITKSLTEFNKRTDTGKYRTECKECKNQQHKEHRIKNAEVIRIQRKAYRTANSEIIKEKKKKHYQENKDQCNERHRQWRKETAEARRQVANKRYNERYRNDPKFHITTCLRKRLQKVVKGECKSAPTLELLGCSVDDLKEYLEFMFDDKMTWNNHGSYWHIDHILPCASFDLTDPEQQKRCFHYTNLQPLEAKENIRKGAKIPTELTKNEDNIDYVEFTVTEIILFGN
jgi:hypothetical protein